MVPSRYQGHLSIVEETGSARRDSGFKVTQLGVKEPRVQFRGVCSHEIKRRLLLGRKVMTNLDSIFKSRDITLLTNVCIVKAIVFPLVKYGCESWTRKKAE